MPSTRKPVRAQGSKPRTAQKIEVENVNVPGYTHRVDAAMYAAMRKIMLGVLPRKMPGLTQAEMLRALAARVPQELFPDEGKVGWWMKTVQLDLEAKKVVVREPTKPLRWHRSR